MTPNIPNAVIANNDIYKKMQMPSPMEPSNENLITLEKNTKNSEQNHLIEDKERQNLVKLIDKARGSLNFPEKTEAVSAVNKTNPEISVTHVTHNRGSVPDAVTMPLGDFLKGNLLNAGNVDAILLELKSNIMKQSNKPLLPTPLTNPRPIKSSCCLGPSFCNVM